ncbi:MAG TPA: hypothetical protein VKY82_08770 [Flavobacterium sp.]|nr:hypothetical protein [Flavobacterium sp.]
MNKIYFLLMLILISSCGNQTEMQSRIDQLQLQNDSLNSELKKFENKFVFEKVFVKHYPIKNSRIKKGEKYYGEFVFVPDVPEDLVQFGTVRDTSKQGYEIKNPIILKAERGGFGAYQFEIDIENDTTDLYFKPIIKDELSLKHFNASYNGIMISDKLIVK